MCADIEYIQYPFVLHSLLHLYNDMSVPKCSILPQLCVWAENMPKMPPVQGKASLLLPPGSAGGRQLMKPAADWLPPAHNRDLADSMRGHTGADKPVDWPTSACH